MRDPRPQLSPTLSARGGVLGIGMGHIAYICHPVNCAVSLCPAGQPLIMPSLIDHINQRYKKLRHDV